MIEHILGTILFFLGLGGSVKGESTPSATVATASALQQVKLLNTQQLQQQFNSNQQAMQTKVASGRQQFTASLSTIQNQEKKQVVESIQEEFNAINMRRTAKQFEYVVLMNTAIKELLVQLDTYAKASGKNVSAASSKLSQANQALTTASAKVTEQAAKTYTISVSSEAALRNDVKKARTQLANDLNVSQAAVNEARKKLADAYQTIKSLTGQSVTFMPPTMIPVDISNTNVQSSVSGGL